MDSLRKLIAKGIFFIFDSFLFYYQSTHIFQDPIKLHLFYFELISIMLYIIIKFIQIPHLIKKVDCIPF